MTRSAVFSGLGLLLTLTACASNDGGRADEISTTLDRATVGATKDESSQVVDLYTPTEVSPNSEPGVPLVVLVPGGGWVTADPTGLIPLAEALADRGAVVTTITYGAAADDVYFPQPAQDVTCAIADSVAQSRQAGYEPGEVVVVGHSAGAHLGALVTLRPGEFAVGCSAPPVEPDLFVGLAGPYDVVRARTVATDLFGPDSSDPSAWSAGNPLDHAANRPQVDVLLVHGTADDTVPIHFSESFADSLEEGGHAVAVSYPDSVDHHTVYSAEVATPIIGDWLGL